MTPFPVHVRFASEAAGTDVLAVVRYGAPAGHRPTSDGGPLVVDVPLRPLAGGPLEVWSAAGAVRRERSAGIELAAAGDVLFGFTAVPAAEPGELEQRTLDAYTRILSCVGDRRLYRFWNTVPAINDEEDGLERYKLFCRGRSVAFERRFGRDFPAHLPAASAVGSRGGDLTVAFLAGPGEPEHRENPRQVAAWAYPPRYGPRSPSFARATRLPAQVGGGVLISGTASVLGHESMHAGDLGAQVEETARNIEALLADAAEPGRRAPALELAKVFVKRASDLGAARAAVERRIGAATSALYLEADICRAELLIEIEGVCR